MDYSCGSCGDLISDISRHVCAEEFDEDIDRSLEPDICEKIIIEVEKRPLLWDFTLPLQSRSKDLTTKAWEEIGGTLNLTLKDAQAKWRYLRDKFVKTKKDIEGYKPSGSASTSTPQKIWKYYSIMQFLKPFVQGRKSRSNIEILQTVSSPSPEPLTPRSECSDVSAMGSSSKRKRSDVDPVSDQLLKVLNEPPPKFPGQDEVDGFCTRLAGSLRRLPRRKRAEVEIKMLQLLQEAEDSD